MPFLLRELRGSACPLKQVELPGHVFPPAQALWGGQPAECQNLLYTGQPQTPIERTAWGLQNKEQDKAGKGQVREELSFAGGPPTPC